MVTSFTISVHHHPDIGQSVPRIITLGELADACNELDSGSAAAEQIVRQVVIDNARVCPIDLLWDMGAAVVNFRKAEIRERVESN